MSRNISNHQTESPDNLFDLSDMLERNDLYSNFYRGKAVTTDNEQIAIFLGSLKLLNQLKIAKEITINGSFRVKYFNK